MKPDEIAAQSAALNEVVTGFNGNWSQLENEMAGLLHQVLFCKTNYLCARFRVGSPTPYISRRTASRAEAEHCQ
jgi:hypothetical protein